MQLKKLTKPKSIAVVGVSDKYGFGKSAAEGALNSKIRDHVYFVHPRRTEFEGKKCYPTITDLPEVVDCVVLCTRRRPSRDCSEKPAKKESAPPLSMPAVSPKKAPQKAGSWNRN